MPPLAGGLGSYGNLSEASLGENFPDLLRLDLTDVTALLAAVDGV
jgi:hypothetical protein